MVIWAIIFVLILVVLLVLAERSVRRSEGHKEIQRTPAESRSLGRIISTIGRSSGGGNG